MAKPLTMNLAAVGRIHTLMTVLADPRARCIWPGSRRAVSRLFLDADVSWRTIRQAWSLGLVEYAYQNPYLIGRGDQFIGLSRYGARVARIPVPEKRA